MGLGTPNYPKVPNWIDQLAAGRPNNIAASWATLSPQPGNGLLYGVECSEWVPYEPKSKLLEKGRRAFPRYPDSVLAQAPQFPFGFKDCPIWDVPKAPAAQRAVTQSNIRPFSSPGPSTQSLRRGRLGSPRGRFPTRRS
jgi:hypothetical protein